MMTAFRKFAALTAACTILSVAPVLAQTSGTTTPPTTPMPDAQQTPTPGTQQAPTPDARQTPGTTGPGSEAAREFGRERMEEMRRWRGSDDEDRAGYAERRGWNRHHDRDWMGHRGMREGPRSRGEFAGGKKGGMHPIGMKIMFAIVDADGDGALSLEEIQDIHGRIFNGIDENGDGRVEMGEIQAFFHGGEEGSR